MGKQYQSVVTKNQPKVPKAIMKTKRIKLREGMDIQQTTYVPVADSKKPMPMVSTTISVGGESVRLNGVNAEEIMLVLAAMLDELQKQKDELNEIVAEQQEKWHEINSAIYEATKNIKKNYGVHNPEKSEEIIVNLKAV